MISGTVVGNVGKDAELQMTSGGTAILKFSVASSSKQKDEEVTTWVNCALFGKRGEALAKYIRKGDPIAVSGTLVLRGYTKKDGSAGSSLDLNVTEVKLLGGAPARRETTQQASSVSDDEIPF